MDELGEMIWKAIERPFSSLEAGHVSMYLSQLQNYVSYSVVVMV